jgi:hypothetical protein
MVGFPYVNKKSETLIANSSTLGTEAWDSAYFRFYICPLYFGHLRYLINNTLLIGVQAIERQGDLMSRSLAQQSGLLNDYQNEKAALMGQLNAMKGVCTSSLSKLVLDIHPLFLIP